MSRLTAMLAAALLDLELDLNLVSGPCGDYPTGSAVSAVPSVIISTSLKRAHKTTASTSTSTRPGRHRFGGIAICPRMATNDMHAASFRFLIWVYFGHTVQSWSADTDQ